MTYPPAGPPSGSYSTTPPPSQAARPVPTLGAFLSMGGGLLALISGLLPWLSGGGETLAGFNRFFGLTWLVPVCGIALLGIACARTFLPNLPPTIATFTWDQLTVVAASVATVVVLNFLIIQERGGAELGAGVWLAALAVIAALVGSILQLLGINPTVVTGPVAPGAPGPVAPPAPPAPGYTPPTPGYGPPPGGYAPPPTPPATGDDAAPGFKPPPGYDGR